MKNFVKQTLRGKGGLWPPGKVPAVFFFILLVCHLMLFSGCYHYRIVADEDPCHAIPKEKTVWSYAWGLVQPVNVKAECDCGVNAIENIQVENNMGYILLSTVSLGLVSPIKVKWYCAKDDFQNILEEQQETTALEK